MVVPIPNDVLISGHRGYKATEIENTKKAFEKAIEHGIDFVEFDVKITKDRIPVVFHDSNMQRLLGANENIQSVPFKHLQQYRYADGQHVLTLEELLVFTKDKIHLMLEIKSRGIEHEVLTLLKKHGREGDTIVQSFNANDIKRSYTINPRLTYGLCIGPVGNIGKAGTLLAHALIAHVYYWLFIRPLPVTYLNVDGPLVTDAFMHLCVKHGKQTILGSKATWNYLDKIVPWNVKIINADDPAYIKQLLDKQKRK